MPTAVLALITEILALVPQLAAAGISVVSLMEKAKAALESNAAPSDVDWQDAHAQTTALLQQLNSEPS